MQRTMSRLPGVRALHLALWAVVLACVAFIGFSDSSPFAQSALAYYPGGSSGACCTYSSQCPGTQICYLPSGGQANCSMTDPNYCK